MQKDTKVVFVRCILLLGEYFFEIFSENVCLEKYFI